MEPYLQFRQAKYFAPLDGLRAISILAVVWHHAQHGTSGILSRGHLGVQLFFAISGVLITTLLIRERQKKGEISLRDFYMRRSLRIFPLYYAVIALYVVLVLTMERGTERGNAFFQHLPSYLTYTSNWFVGLSQGASVIFYFAWSLATEEQFYLFWPSIMRFCKHWGVQAIAIASVLALGELSRWGSATGLVDSGMILVRVANSIASPICLGCLVALLLDKPRGFSIAYRIAGQPWSAPLALLLVGLIMTRDFPSLVIALGMVYLVTACVVRESPLLNACFANPIARYIGSISYGMYLLHMIALNAVRKVIGPDASALLRFCATTALTVVLATASFRLLEQPFLRLKARFAR